jgi:3-oxoacyl-[acyl-carrier protein] reductase
MRNIYFAENLRKTLMHQSVVLITGCATGIGKHLAEKFYNRNYQVVATDADPEWLKRTFAHWDTEGCLLEKLDVRKAEDWQRIINLTVAEFGQLDICINNEGVIASDFVMDMNFQDIDYQIDVNTKGVLYGTKFAAELMMRQGAGHIINFSTLSGFSPVYGLSVYAASKQAVRAFTLSIVPELKSKGVHISVICPDLVDMHKIPNAPKQSFSFFKNKNLTVLDIEEAVFVRALKDHEVEILVPKNRGFLAKLGNLFPWFGFRLARFFAKKEKNDTKR